MKTLTISSLYIQHLIISLYLLVLYNRRSVASSSIWGIETTHASDILWKCQDFKTFASSLFMVYSFSSFVSLRKRRKRTCHWIARWKTGKALSRHFYFVYQSFLQMAIDGDTDAMGLHLVNKVDLSIQDSQVNRRHDEEETGGREYLHI